MIATSVLFAILTHVLVGSALLPTILWVFATAALTTVIIVGASHCRAAQAKANAAQKQAETYLSAAAQIIVSLDSTQKITLLNDNGYELLGYSRGTLDGKNWFGHVVPEEKRKEGRAVLSRFMSGESGNVFTYRGSVENREGHSLTIQWRGTLLKGEAAENSGVLLSGSDVTLEHEQSKRLALLNLAVEHAASTIVITAADGTIVYANPTFEVTTGYKLSEVIGKNIKMMKSGKQNRLFYNDLWATITAGETWRGRFHNRRKDGTYYWESAVISPFFDSQKNLTHYVAVKENITEQLAVQKALEERNHELEQFNSAAVGRELRMIDLKRQVNSLSEELGQGEIYPLGFLKNGAKRQTG